MPDENAPRLVSLYEHAANQAPEAILVSPFHQRDAIYKTAAGFVAVFKHIHAIDGYFVTQAEAQHALDMLKRSDVVPELDG